MDALAPHAVLVKCIGCVREPRHPECFIGKWDKVVKTCNECRAKEATYYLKPEVHARKTTYRKINKDRDCAQQKLRVTSRLKHIKNQAANRNITWDLSTEQATSLVQRGVRCFYCDTEPEDALNGIDRMDSKAGYIASNCVSCCGTCNMTKGSLDAQTFVERCGQVSVHHGGPGAVTTAWRDTKTVTFSGYRSKNKAKNLAFELSREDFESIVCGGCTYCGRGNTGTHKNGIDRLDSAAGYTLTNCVPCCGECNIAKKTLTSSSFIDKCKAVAGRVLGIPAMPRCLEVISRRTKM